MYELIDIKLEALIISKLANAHLCQDNTNKNMKRCRLNIRINI